MSENTNKTTTNDRPPISPRPLKHKASWIKPQPQSPPAEEDENSFATSTGGVAGGSGGSSTSAGNESIKKQTRTTPISGSRHGLATGSYHGLPSTGSKHGLSSGSRQGGLQTGSFHSPAPIASKVELVPSTKLVMLVSSLFTYTAKQNRVLTIMRAKGIEPEIVDGSDPSNANLRDKYFGISGKWSQYPQFFAVDDRRTDSKIDFIGEYETIVSLNDRGNLTKNKLLSTRVPQSPSAMTFRKTTKVTAKQNIMGEFGGLAPLAPDQDIGRQSYSGKVQQLPVSPSQSQTSELSKVQLKKKSDHSHIPVSPGSQASELPKVQLKKTSDHSQKIQPPPPPPPPPRSDTKSPSNLPLKQSPHPSPPPPPPPPPPPTSGDNDLSDSHSKNEAVNKGQKATASSSNKTQNNIAYSPSKHNDILRKALDQLSPTGHHGALNDAETTGPSSLSATPKGLPTVNESEKVPLLEMNYPTGDDSWLPPSQSAMAKYRSTTKSRQSLLVSQQPPIRSARVDFTGAILNNAEGSVHWLPPSMLDENNEPLKKIEVERKSIQESNHLIPKDTSNSKIAGAKHNLPKKNEGQPDSKQRRESFDASGLVTMQTESSKLNDSYANSSRSSTSARSSKSGSAGSANRDAALGERRNSVSSSEEDLAEPTGFSNSATGSSKPMLSSQGDDGTGKDTAIEDESSRSSSMEAGVALEDVVRSSDSPTEAVPRSIAVQKQVAIVETNGQELVPRSAGQASRSHGTKRSSDDGKSKSCMNCQCIFGSFLAIAAVAAGVVLFYFFYNRDTSSDSSSISSGPPGMDSPSQAPMPPSAIQPNSPSLMGPPSSQDGETGRDILLDLLTRVSIDNGASLRDPSSPQYAAMEWIRTPNNSGIFTDERFLARYALAVLYYSTRGDEWTSASNWLTELHECDWFSGNSGIINSPSCDDELNFVHLDLTENNLHGTLPPELMLLGHLDSILLSKNAIYGTIPSVFGDLEQLTTLKISDNKLTGPIPKELSRLNRLNDLILQDNKLSSSISTSLGELRRLQVLSLGSNKLTGTIPSEIGRLLALATLSLFDNDLTGTIPEELENLVNLNSLYLDNTLLGPSLPVGICDLASLEDFWSDCDELGGCDCCTTCCIDDVVCL